MNQGNTMQSNGNFDDVDLAEFEIWIDPDDPSYQPQKRRVVRRRPNAKIYDLDEYRARKAARAHA